MFWEAEQPGAGEWYDPYWQLHGLAPELIDDVRRVIRLELGVDPSSPEAFELDVATASALGDRWNSGELGTVENLRLVPPELAAVWGVNEFISTAELTTPKAYPPRPILGLRSVSISTRYRVAVTTFLPLEPSPYTNFQLHGATRNRNLYNGRTREWTTQCLLGIRKSDGVLIPLPVATLERTRLVEVETQHVEAQGLRDFISNN